MARTPRSSGAPDGVWSWIGGGEGQWTWVRAHVVDRHGARWRAEVRVGVRERDRRLLVGELRVYPDEGEGRVGREGEWSRDLAAVPPHGLEARTLKQIRLGGVPAVVLATHSRDRQDPNQHWRQASGVFNRLMLPGVETLERPRPRRSTGRDDRFYAVLAAEYLDLIAAGERHPVKALAARRGETSAHIRDWLHEGRVRGLLSPAPAATAGSRAGVPGGSLLPAALAFLHRSAGGAPKKKSLRSGRRGEGKSTALHRSLHGAARPRRPARSS